MNKLIVFSVFSIFLICFAKSNTVRADEFLEITLDQPVTPTEPSEPTITQSEKCKSELKEYFSNPQNPKVKEFLELQSDITAHRLAWAYMILWQKRGKGLEGVIKDLVAKRDADPELVRLYQEFKKN